MHAFAILFASTCLIHIECVNTREAMIMAGINAAIEATQVPGSERVDAILADATALYLKFGKFTEATRTAKMIQTKNSREMAFVGIALEHARIGDYQHAMRIARNLSQRNHLIRDIALLQASQGKCTAALETVAHIKDTTEMVLAFLRISIRLSKNETADQAGQVILRASDLIRSTPLTEKVAFNFALAYAYAGQRGPADDYMRQLPNIDGQEGSQLDYYRRKVAVGLAKSGNFNDAVSLANEITKLNWWDKGETLLRIGAIRIQQGDVTGAEKMAFKAKAEEALWTERLLLKLVKHYAKRHKFAKALEIVNRIDMPTIQVRALLYIADSQRNSSEVSKVGSVDQSLQTARNLIHDLKNADQAEMYIKLGKYYATHKEIDAAQVNLNAAMGVAKTIDYSDITIASFRGHLRDIVKLQLELKDREEAKKTLRFAWTTLKDLDQRGVLLGEVALDSYPEIAKFFVKAEDLDEALELAKTTVGAIQASVITSIAEELGKTNDWNGVARKMKRSVPNRCHGIILIAAVRGALAVDESE